MANTVELLDRQTSQILNDSMSTYYTTKQNIVFVAQELVENLAYLANTDVQTRKTNIIRNSLFRNRTKINTNVVPPAEPIIPAETPKTAEIKSSTDDLMRMFEEPPAAAASVAPPEASHPPIVPPAPVMEGVAPQQGAAFDPFSMPPVVESSPAADTSTEELLNMFNEPAAATPAAAPEPVYNAPPVPSEPVYTPPSVAAEPVYTPSVESQPDTALPFAHARDTFSELDSFFVEPSAESVAPQQPEPTPQPQVYEPVQAAAAQEFTMPPVMENPPPVVEQPSYAPAQQSEPSEVSVEQPLQQSYASAQIEANEEAIGQTLLNLDELKNRISTTDSNVYISPNIKSHFSSILMEIEASLSNMKSYSTNREMLISLYERLKNNQNMSMQEMVELSRHIVEANQFVEEYQAKAKDELDSMENVAELFKNMADALVYNIRKAKNDFNRGN